MALIRKIGLCIVRDGRLLVFRKTNGRTWILPGGKPENGETDVQALEREVMDECGRRIVNAVHLLTCRSPAADRPGDEVELVAYVGEIDGEPVIAAEIVEAAWLDVDRPQLPIAQSIVDHVLPALRLRPGVPPEKTRLVRYDADAQRIQRGDAVVAMALRLANDRWCLTDANDRRIGRMTYDTPKDVLKAYDALAPEDRS
jgi:8-oxo-dGTP diphosphatase